MCTENAIIEAYTLFARETHAKGSGAAHSYVTAFKEQFCKYQGVRLRLPSQFTPSQVFLEKHRQLLA